MRSPTSTTSRLRAVLWAAAGALAAADAAYLLAMKRGSLAPRPAVLAALVCVTALALCACAVEAAVRAARGPRRVSALAAVLGAAGLIAVGAGGFATWAFSLQGFVVVAEREPVRLARTETLDAFVAGPLANLRELHLTLALARLELVGAGPEHFRAVSRLRVLDAAGEEVGISVDRGSAARFRTLVFHQGAFGFAPRIVVTQRDRPLLDEHVPFRTVREGPAGIAFARDFEISREKLLLRCALALDDLNEDMKGHPRLELSIEREGVPVGAGTLKPGEFADLADGYRVGFAGLRRWSEIDISRRTYDAPIRVGLALFAASVLLWPLAAWRRW